MKSKGICTILKFTRNFVEQNKICLQERYTLVLSSPRKSNVLAGLAIGGFRPVAAGVAVMLTGWGAGEGVVGMPAGWVVGGVGGSGSAMGMVGGSRARRARSSL